MSGDEKSGVRIVSEEILSDDWARLTKYTIERRQSDGVWHKAIRQVYDRGNGAAILPVDPARGTILLVRQFRMPVFLNPQSGRGDGMLLEACAGLLDANDPETAIRKEAEEELGVRLGAITQVFDTYMSPGSVSERLTLYVADYTPADRVFAGGGLHHEGEDIEVVELPLTEATAMMARGEISDAKTVILLQYLAAKGPNPLSSR